MRQITSLAVGQESPRPVGDHVGGGIYSVGFFINTVLSLAARDTDRPLAPKTQTVPPNATMPAAAQPVVNIGKTGSIQFFMVAQNQAVVHVAGAEFKVTGPGANPATFTVKDNGPTDGDQTLGVVLLKGMTPGIYQVCMTVPPGNYGVAAPTCRGAGVVAGTTTGHYWQIPPLPSCSGRHRFSATLFSGTTMTRMLRKLPDPALHCGRVSQRAGNLN